MIYKTYIKLEIKNSIKKLPKMIIGAAMLMLVISAVAFCCSTYLYNSETPIIKLAIACEDDSNLMNIITTAIKSSKSTSDLCELTFTTRDELYKGIDNGTFHAGCILKENQAHNILNGENTPIELVFCKDSGFEAELLTTFTKTVASLLNDAQNSSSISAHYYKNNNKEEYIKDMADKLDFTNLQAALQRQATFSYDTITGTGNVDTDMYYIASCIIMFMMFFSICITLFYNPRNKHIECKLLENNVSFTKQLFAKFLSCYLCYLVISLICFPIIAILLSAEKATLILLCLIIFALQATSLSLLVLRIFENGSISVLFQFMMITLICFVSGCIIPITMLNDSITYLSYIFPVRYALNVISNIAMNGHDAFLSDSDISIKMMINLLMMLILSSAYILLTILADKIKRKFEA